MSDARTNLADMEEAVADLVANLGSARSIHDRLDAATTEITAAHGELGEANRMLGAMQTDAAGMLDQIRHLQPERLERAIDAGVGAITRVTTERLGALDDRLARLTTESSATNASLLHEVEAVAALHRTGNAALREELGANGTSMAVALNETAARLASRVDEAAGALAATLSKMDRDLASSVSVIAEGQKALTTDITTLQERQMHLQRTTEQVSVTLRETSDRVSVFGQDLRRQQTELLAAIALLETTRASDHARLAKDLRGNRILMLIGFLVLALVLALIALRLTG